MARSVSYNSALTLFLLFLTFSIMGESTKIILGTTDIDNRPYVIGEGGDLLSENPGITIEILHRIEKELNVEFEIIREPWARIQLKLEYGEVNGIFHASYTEDRARIGVYPRVNCQIDTSRSIFLRAYSLYAKKDSPIFWNGDTIGNLSGPVGVIRGYAIIDDLNRMGIPIEEIVDPVQGMELLLIDRISAFAELENSGDHILSHYGDRYGDIVKLSPPLQMKPYYVIFSNSYYENNPQLVENIWYEIKEIVISGEYERIYLRYMEMDSYK